MTGPRVALAAAGLAAPLALLGLVLFPRFDGATSENHESMLVIAFAVNWHVSWWEWHVLMVLVFAFIAYSARREWHEERFSALYLDHVLRGARDVSVLFADLQGSTTFAERTDPEAVTAMLNASWERIVPMIEEEYGGEVHQLIGDAVMAVFNKDGEAPEHAALAAALRSPSSARPPRSRASIPSGHASGWA